MCRMPTQSHRLLARLQAETTPQGRWAPNRGTKCCGSGGGCPRPRRRGGCMRPPTSGLARVWSGSRWRRCCPPWRRPGGRSGHRRARQGPSATSSSSCRCGWTRPPGCAVRSGSGARRGRDGAQRVRDAAELRLFLLDQDGPEPDDAERARKRRVTVGRQGRDAMTP